MSLPRHAIQPSIVPVEIVDAVRALNEQLVLAERMARVDAEAVERELAEMDREVAQP